MNEREPLTSEQKEALENERAISDAKLIEGGARWKLDEKDERGQLEITEAQAQEMRMDYENGIVDNLGTYIRMNKSILLSPEEMSGDLREELKKYKGHIWPHAGDYEFVDKDGYLAKFRVDPDKVKSLSEKNRTQRGVTGPINRAIDNELAGLGFIIGEKPPGNLGMKIYDDMTFKLKQEKKKEKEAKAAEFNF